MSRGGSAWRARAIRCGPWPGRSEPMGPAPAVEDGGAGKAAVLVRRLLRWLTVGVFLVHAYTVRHMMNPDGISYLEVAGAYLRGDAAGALNFYWGPLLSALLAGAQALLPLGPYWEATVAHGVIVLTFALSLLAFEWLLTEV